MSIYELFHYSLFPGLFVAFTYNKKEPPAFGAAPAFLLYFWKLKEIKVIGWMLVMVYVICMSIRLARFNVSLHSEQRSWKKMFFSGNLYNRLVFFSGDSSLLN